MLISPREKRRDGAKQNYPMYKEEGKGREVTKGEEYNEDIAETT